MSKTQQSPLAPPSEKDEQLKDYTSKIQEGFDSLFEDSHFHDKRTEAPASNEGQVGDIVLVETETERYIAIKYSSGWFRTAALTAI